jgi:hypothetical protein
VRGTSQTEHYSPTQYGFLFYNLYPGMRYRFYYFIQDIPLFQTYYTETLRRNLTNTLVGTDYYGAVGFPSGVSVDFDPTPSQQDQWAIENSKLGEQFIIEFKAEKTYHWHGMEGPKVKKSIPPDFTLADLKTRLQLTYEGGTNLAKFAGFPQRLAAYKAAVAAADAAYNASHAEPPRPHKITRTIRFVAQHPRFLRVGIMDDGTYIQNGTLHQGHAFPQGDIEPASCRLPKNGGYHQPLTTRDVSTKR